MKYTEAILFVSILAFLSCSEKRIKGIDEIVLAEYIVEKDGIYFSGDCEIHIGDKFTGPGEISMKMEKLKELIF